MCVCVRFLLCCHPLVIIERGFVPRASTHTFLKSLCPQLSLTSVLTLTLVTVLNAPLHTLLLSCDFPSLLSFLTPFTSPRLMSFPPAVMHHSCPPPPKSPLILCSLSPLSPVMQRATPPRKVSDYQTSHSFTSRLLSPHLSLPPLASDKPPNSVD